jgi:hypothetical protein
MSATDPALLNYVIRMVVPLKREFGESLDVQQFMRDPGYSQRILAQARSSQDQRLRDYADYVSSHVHGARQGATGPAVATAAPAAPAGTLYTKSPASAQPMARMPASRAPSAPPAPAPRSAPAAAPAVGGEPTAEELRARMLKKYTSGLR